MDDQTRFPDLAGFHMEGNKYQGYALFECPTTWEFCSIKTRGLVGVKT